MIGLVRWLGSHRSVAATGILITAITVASAVVGVSSTGYHAQRLDLHDGTVWVANGEQTAIGRANPAVAQLNSAVRSTGSDLSAVQDPAHVILLDRTNATAGLVDPATATVAQTVPLPPEAPDVLLAGDTAVIVSNKTGAFWPLPAAELPAFDAQSQPALNLGAQVSTGLSPGGVLTAYSAVSGTVSRIDSISAFAVSSSAQLALPKTDSFQVASVGSHSAVLDTTSRTIVVDGRRVPLGDRVSGRLALQRSADAGDAFLVASSAGLLSISFGGEVRQQATARDGNPARPVVLGGCVYAAWSDGVGWRQCDRTPPVTLSLRAMPASAAPEFAVNGDQVVANDPIGGASWAVQRGGELIDNWSDLIRSGDEKKPDSVQTPHDEQKPEVDQKPPVAVDDAFGARPGRTTVLPVLLNDYDPNGDPLVVTGVSGLAKGLGSVGVMESRQQLQLTLPAAAVGELTFDYSISDGRGGDASARVTVTVRTADENGAPRQLRSERVSVASSGRVTFNVLGEWVDPDGDPLYLADASGGDGGSVAFTPAGDVTYQDRGAGPSTQEIALTVSDGRATGRGTLTIEVQAAGSVALQAKSFSVEAYAGIPVTVSPLGYATGGTGPIKLNSVPSRAGSTITPNYAAGTFSFLSSVVGTHNIEYTVTDGSKSATATARIDVQTPPESNTPPVTAPKTLFIQTLSTQTVDVGALASDPAGNVLMLTALAAPDPASGVQAQLIDQQSLRVTLTAPLDDGPVTVAYTVSNGLSSSQGTVTVVEIPRPPRFQPPVAVNDQVTARVGEAVTIDVLANDSQPDGAPITLEQNLVKNVSPGGGLLFVSGDRIRYLAPRTPGNFTAEYAIDGPDGQRATAQLSLAVREADAASNSAPVPQTLTGRVVAGQTIRIQIPLDDIDPDGDSVQFIGLDSNPQKGSATSVGANYFDYQAGSYSAGTDTFGYTVVDGLGARATGIVRIGIAARADGSRNPIAVADTVSMRPGGSILVRVLANDSDPDGGALHVASVKGNESDVRSEILPGGVVRVTPPKREGSYGLVYRVENETGGSSSTFITVTVNSRAPLNYPEAQDTVLSLRSVLGRTSVDVDVLANVFYADGDATSLGLGVEPGFDATARVLPNHRIRVALTDDSQIVPFFVSRPDDPSIRAYAFIKVPGFNDARPQINEAAPPLIVLSEKTLSIDLNKYVVSAGSHGVRLTDSSTVKATHANGADLVANATTLVYTSAASFFGQASISFDVTDGTSASDPKGHTATLVLPIRVEPRADQPPVFSGASLDLEPGDSRTLDLTRLTSYSDPSALARLRYAVTTQTVPGFGYRLDGQSLTVTADTAAQKGTTSRLGLTVDDGVSAPQSGSLELNVVGSTRPLPVAAPDSAIVRRGATATIDVLANDRPTNPFPGQPLKVLAIRGADGESLPPGVSVAPSADNRVLSVSVAADARPVDAHLQYQLADVTNDPSRYVWGEVTVSVQDVPDAPGAPVRSGAFTPGQLTLAYSAPVSNNSPITSYRLTGSSSAGGYSKDCGASTICTLTDLAPGVPYRFTVRAVNAIGASDDSAPSAPISADRVPAAPESVRAAPSTTTPGALDLSWKAVPQPAQGSAVSGYVVEVSGAGAPGQQNVAGTTTTITGLTPGGHYSIQVYATNAAQVSSSADWARSAPVTATAIGVPSTTDVSATSDPATGVVRITHGASDPAGADSVSYTIARADGSDQPAPQCTPTSKPMAIDAPGGVDSSARDGQSYTYFVYADNGLFCSTSAANATVLLAPGKAQAQLSLVDSKNGYFDVKVGTLGVAAGQATSYRVSSNGGAFVVVRSGDLLTGSDLSVYGSTQQYVFEGCRGSDGTVCGAPSDTVSIVPVSANVTNLSFSSNASGSTWSFNVPRIPDGGSVQYRCQNGSPITATAGANSCTGAASASEQPSLQIVVTANGGQTYSKAYSRADAN